MRNYYFLAPSLPPLTLGEWPDLLFEELISRFRLNLTAADFQKSRAIRRCIDLLNVRALYLKEPLDPRGNLTERELDEALLLESYLPSYLFDFLKRFETAAEREENFSFLLSSYLKGEWLQQTGFLKRYFRFEWEWRLVLTALRAKELQRDLLEELKFEDSSDPFIQEILSQRESSVYEPPTEYGDLKGYFLSCGSDPWQHYEGLAKWRFTRVEQLCQGPLFSLDWVLAYFVQHLLTEDLAKLSVEKGEEILRKVAGA
ncbi:MAG: hypothetical protein A2Y28_01160 [Chlamydiae bacterium GWC2_50_10]|nr:MAG: hypothetical protein A2Z85_01205 [Chlamydiae bacterium GWA2_50_15]OGN53804.1 MAG: hypothetical protein A2Y28_01160 [Chlamydiae bacterium GWC2_50_10]OGN57754.1 MAG: hypothetical protein A3D18_04830 [Chlamydiae bacterium RIFCSPHIGHO2_02_FULL_49_29]OGN62623.1 MAG: hypothetical protein A3E26_00700 [Chlamydiae bacterium RIFCSPHIGHO2_12_FULL_49_32]OGN68229.1 MAG: hypothetical protein A3I15_05115 [Chlamydiae bacterium RIFCSPLOWO2_02_FULL_49_12]OGN72876.1 MAG: hypothetical protein A3G30_01680 